MPLVQLAADPWEMLDPHDPESGGETINRFRKIKSYRVPRFDVKGGTCTYIKQQQRW